MRLGMRPTIFEPNTESSKCRKYYSVLLLSYALIRLLNNNCFLGQLYGNVTMVEERHRHRYEVNPEYVSVLEKEGMRFVGRDEAGERMEIMELDGHPYYVAAQYHPELKTRPLRPSPLFKGLIAAAIKSASA